MSNILTRVAEGATALAKIVLLSRHVPRSKPRGGRIIVMGNGPSLNSTIAGHMELLKESTLMAVNFAAIAPVFSELKPQYYIFADPYFFKESLCENDCNLSLLREKFAGIDSEMVLLVPRKYLSKAKDLYGNDKISILPFNDVGIDGAGAFAMGTFDRRLAMPRPRNVLIPAIMNAIWLGFDTIYIVGADHSWMTSLSVTDDNEVVSVQPHFYADGDGEQKRVRHEYRGYRLHQIVESFAVAFRSYHAIEAYARHCGVEIYNATPGSFIDAFPRKTL